MKVFIFLFQINKSTKIIDIGGTPINWQYIEANPNLLLVNIFMPKVLNKKFKYLVADGKQLPFVNQAFDIAYSNSVIEHLCDFEEQLKFADEVQRIGKKYYVQTPNKYFPVEPHYITPFIHFFPKSVQKKLLRYFSIWGLITKPSKESIEKIVNEINLLGPKEMKKLFPDSKVIFERFLLMTKSIIAIKCD
jgi:ubiquinone/menaquinone biosynthesis C-methylase UbiE